MRSFIFGWTCLSVSLLLSSAACVAQVATDPKAGGVDFEIQGEYSGELETSDGKQKFGVQIVAVGKGKFRGVGFHGGLPGDGWNGENPTVLENEGVLENDEVKFVDKHGEGVIRGGEMHCKLAAADKAAGVLKKVERKSTTLGQKPPEGAVVLFDGASAEGWHGGRLTDDGLLMEGVTSKKRFGSHTLHVEFRLPFMPEARGQGRGNSGLYLQGRYEVQMLDSFGLAVKDNECGGIYSVKAADLNMCFPPLAWQTYDVDYTAAKYDDEGKLAANPRVTVRHNGVVIHNDVELPGNRNTTAAPVKAGPEPGPVYLQNHGNPVRYRNIWVVETK